MIAHFGADHVYVVSSMNVTGFVIALGLDSPEAEAVAPATTTNVANATDKKVRFPLFIRVIMTNPTTEVDHVVPRVDPSSARRFSINRFSNFASGFQSTGTLIVFLFTS